MPKQIPLTQGKSALVDDEDYERLSQFKWCAWQCHPRRLGARPLWYARRNVYLGRGSHGPGGGMFKAILLHREVLAGGTVDHVDGDGLNNTRANLRLVTPGQSARNQIKTWKPTTSRYKGVCWYKQTKKWKAQISVLGKRTGLGYFADETMAARAYDAAATRLFGEFAHLNNPLS